jgi:hypothetical protein
MSAPPIIWIDERIARGLPQDKDPELAERGVDQIRYIAQDRVNELVRAARGLEAVEFIVEIAAGQGIIYGISNEGRLWAYGQTIGIQDQIDGVPERTPGWYLIAEAELPA